jgi:hypothetical protein
LKRTSILIMSVLGTLILIDLVAAPLAARVTGHAKPPAFAPVLMVALAVLTAVAMFGLARDASWSPGLTYATRGVDFVSGLLGVLTHPSTGLVVLGAATDLFSIVAVVMLVLSKRRTRLPNLQKA